MTAARRELRKTDQGIELLALNLLEGLAALGLRNPLTQLDDVLQAIGKPGIGGLSIAPGTARFLIVGLNRFGQIEMSNKSNVRLVDAHSEGNCCNDDDAVLVQEAGLCSAAYTGLEPCMVGERRASFCG